MSQTSDTEHYGLHVDIADDFVVEKVRFSPFTPPTTFNETPVHDVIKTREMQTQLAMRQRRQAMFGHLYFDCWHTLGLTAHK